MRYYSHLSILLQFLHFFVQILKLIIVNTILLNQKRKKLITKLQIKSTLHIFIFCNYLYKISSLHSINPKMDQNLKKKIVIVKGFIQKKQYKQALDQLEVLMYKYQKAYQVHLMSGLCYQKIGKEIQAQKCYKQVIDLKDDQPNAIKALCEIYTKRNDIKNATIFLQKNVQLLKKVDDVKYREALVKLIDIYRKDEVLEKIYNIFCQYIQKEQKIGQDFVHIGAAYFNVSIQCKSFNLQKFQLMGWKGQTPRLVDLNARQKLNSLLIDIVNYLIAVSKQFKLTQKDIANSLYQMRYYFPYAPCMLMLLLMDEYVVGQVPFSGIILEEIYKLLSAYYKKENNGYLNMEFTQPEIFTVSMVLGYQYLAFFKEFFTLDPCFDEYFEDLALKQEQLLKNKVRQDYTKRINNFILKKCRHLNKISQTKNVQNQIQQMKKRIQLLQGSFLEQVIAKMAMNCIVNYQKLDDMKNMLKIRIKNLQQGDMVPHLYKYYIDYLIKIAKIYKILDEQINIYDAIDYINKYDPNDMKYLIQGYWLKFSKSMLLQNNQQKIKIAHESIENVQKLLPNIDGQLKSEALRRIAVMKIYSGDLNVQKQLKEALSLDRSFANLQSIGFFSFYKGKFQESLGYLKEAFILNQTHYHTNRLIFVLLFKLGYKNQAIDFVQRIKQGFRSVFWINYVLALKYINLKKYKEAQNYLNTSIQSYSAGMNKKYKFSFEKTLSHDKFAFLYMIEQNQISILYDQIIFPQPIIYNELKMVSSLYFENDTKRTQVKLLYQMGEVQKILGRTKSSVNYLNDSYTLSLQMTQQELNAPGQRLELCVMQKQYATILFYMQMFRQSQSALNSSYQLCRKELQEQKDQSRLKLLLKIQSQILSLSFQIAVQRLSIMIKFESYETVEQFLKLFKVQQPKCPSINFLKGKYQFHILEYLHKRHNIQSIQASIFRYLQYFNLKIQQINTPQFENKYFDFDSDKKLMIKQALQDYFVIKYISAPEKLSSSDIMPLIQLFPRSTIFYIIFGMSTSDLKLKTASFLKCIQLDKQSPISIDLLASLYLKQKNYLAATKLFLKSLQLNILNTKCYLGLSICLFCIIGKSISIKDSQVIETIHKALIRINSYMQYLRTVDPSQNYHLLQFLKLLVNDKKISNFEIKTVLQASKKNTKYKYKDTLIYQLLEQATNDWKDHNIWQEEGQIKIVQRFISSFSKIQVNKINSQCEQISVQLIKMTQNLFKQLNESENKLKQEQFFVKEIQVILNKLCIGLSLGMKGKFNQNLFNRIIKLVQNLEQKYKKIVQITQQNNQLVKKLKTYLFQYCLQNDKYDQHKNKISSIFYDIHTYQRFMKYPHKIKKFQIQLFREILLNPENQQLKFIHSNHFVVNAGKKLNKGKFNYKVQIVNNTHDNLVIKKQSLKKLILLYNEPSSYTQFISISWSNPIQRTKPNCLKWLKIINKLLSDKSTQLNPTNLTKLSTLKLQIYSYFISQFSSDEQSLKKINLKLTKDETSYIELLNNIHAFYKNQGNSKQQINRLKNMKKLLGSCKQTDKQNNFALLQLLSYITNKYEYNTKIQQILIKLIQMPIQQEKSHFKSHLLLLRFIYILHRPVKTQQDLINQIVDLEKIIGECQQRGVHENTISILKCAKCLISADYQNLEVELSVAAQKKVVTYSDQVLINFFEIMRIYKEVENNPNKQGIIEEFVVYIQHMIVLVKDPFYQGFFYSLKAMVNSIIVPQESFANDRNLRFSMILSPYGAKSLLKNNQ